MDLNQAYLSGCHPDPDPAVLIMFDLTVLVPFRWEKPSGLIAVDSDQLLCAQCGDVTSN